ncbi:MAG: hypothetical protein MUC96_19465 [Myxococcaceae bacterium]|jgi:hypothetical protein|nr:hypothetical protein [Myxococcaceae bacterium]
MNEPVPHENTAPFQLPASLRRGALAAWRPGLLDRLEQAEVTLDGGAVADVDGPSLEGLVAFVRRRQRDGRPTRWSAVSVGLRRAATWLGFVEALGLPPEES